MTTFTREDFEHAARTIGMRLDSRPKAFYRGAAILVDAVEGDVAIVNWCPPDNDGDALRLARRLRMTIADEPSRGGWSVGAVVNGAFAWLAHDDDQRAAIFRAAIAIGKAMQVPAIDISKSVLDPVNAPAVAYIRGHLEDAASRAAADVEAAFSIDAPGLRPKTFAGLAAPAETGADHQTEHLFLEVRKDKKQGFYNAKTWVRAKFLYELPEGGIVVEREDGTKEAIPPGYYRAVL